MIIYVDIIAEEKVKYYTEIAFERMSIPAREALAKEKYPNKQFIITPLNFIHMYDNGVEIKSDKLPNTYEKIALKMLMWVENRENFQSMEEALDWLRDFEFNPAQIDLYREHILEYVIS